MQRRRRRKSAPKDIFGLSRPSLRALRKPMPTLPRTRSSTRVRTVDETPESPEDAIDPPGGTIDSPEEAPESPEEELGFPTRPTLDDVAALAREVIEETGEANYDVADIVSRLIKPNVVSIMTEPETKGLGLLIGEMNKAQCLSNWSVPERGLLCTQYDGVSIIIDVNQTVSQKIRRDNHHLELYVSPEWHIGWHEVAKRVCLVGKGATATDFVYATVMMRNCGSMNLFFSGTDLPSTISSVRAEKERLADLERQRRSNEMETGIRETDEEREAREGLEEERRSNEMETGIRETDEERRAREAEELRKAEELARLRKLRLERERVLELEKDSNEMETGIRETNWERNDRETRERWDRKVSGWKESVTSEMRHLESRIANSDRLAGDPVLDRRISEARRCITEEMWWAAYSSLGLATKRASSIEEQSGRLAN